MDYEWFEPETIWLQNPMYIHPDSNGEVECEFAFNKGNADFDVCWPSRNDPCTSTTCKVSYLDKGAAEGRAPLYKRNVYSACPEQGQAFGRARPGGVPGGLLGTVPGTA